MNKDQKVIDEFGQEWSRFSYEQFNIDTLEKNFQQYFDIFPWRVLAAQSEGFDMGSGSGRWARFVAPKVGRLNCVEPSQAIEVARQALRHNENVYFYNETSDTCSIAHKSQDFGYCLGVLHHIPDTRAALADCAKLLKPGAPFLLYLYYNFDNKPCWYQSVWKVSDYIRSVICRLPARFKKAICEIIAVSVYLPLARASLLLHKIGVNTINIPLSDYKDKSFYQIRNDALDRFGTRLEQRFSKEEITKLLELTGFERIQFSDSPPYWCAVAFKT